MIIEHVPGSHVNATDTDKLPDVEAMILEKAEELRKLCFDTSRQVVIIVDAKGIEDGGGIHFWSFKLRSQKVQDTDTNSQPLMDKEDIARSYQNLFRMINNFGGRMSNGHVGLKDIRDTAP